MGYKNLAQQFPRRVNAVNPVRRAGPEIAIFVHGQAIGIAGLNLVKDRTAPQVAIRGYVKSANILLGIILGLITGFRNVKAILIGRKDQAVRTVKIIRDRSDAATRGIESIECRRLLRGLPLALIIVLDAI